MIAYRRFGVPLLPTRIDGIMVSPLIRCHPRNQPAVPKLRRSQEKP